METEWRNVGDYEAAVRGVIGAGALAVSVAHRNPVWFVVSLFTFASALFRYCPLNSAWARDRDGRRGTTDRLRAVPTIH